MSIIDHVSVFVSELYRSEAFYSAALAPLGIRLLLRFGGARDFGAPGLRPRYQPGYYGAFVLDPDGHNLEAVHHTV